MAAPNYLLILEDLAETIRDGVAALDRRVLTEAPDQVPQGLAAWLIYQGIPTAEWGGSLDVCLHSIAIVVAVPNNGGGYAGRVRTVNAAAAAIRSAIKGNVVLDDGAEGAVVVLAPTMTGAGGATYGTGGPEIVVATVTVTLETKQFLEVTQ